MAPMNDGKKSDPVDNVGLPNEKLIQRKQDWAREGKHLTGDAKAGAPLRRRLPPGQHETKKWPVLDLGVHPNLSTKDWTLTVGGNVANKIAWSWTDFMAQPQTTLTADIHCVTTWSLFGSDWQGVSARHLLSVVRPAPEIKFLVFHSHDGYTTNVPLAHFAAEDALLAHSWNGKPLGQEHGGPVRAMIPKLYFWKSAKWLKYILFSEKDIPGYWEVRGYHNVGDPWKEERYS